MLRVSRRGWLPRGHSRCEVPGACAGVRHERGVNRVMADNCLQPLQDLSPPARSTARPTANPTAGSLAPRKTACGRNG
ncbi:hypothetical protein E2C01_076369 [Portunus trituberculatus]|uniref:Uncharacterized protein n=1 Tax=Portunus trituberculatus TaxID=210409 RepID=A0A5B7ILV2_PORTR|nr:hypothetical protein [Portunus trituberculatus]